MTAVARPVPAVRLRRVWKLLRNRFLRFPLVLKLAGANALIVLMAWTAAYLDQRARSQDDRVLAVLAIALAAGMVVNLLLVFIALRPLRMLEATAAKVWEGDLAARVPWSPIADAGMEKMAVALNVLLETLSRDRTRARALAGRIIHLGDQQRADVARELQESLAQSLAGLLYQISAAQRACTDPSCARDLETARGIAQRCVEEMRQLSGRVHPRVLDDFGLAAALRHLARTSQTDNTSVNVHVEAAAAERLTGMDGASAAVLYRVAEEAVRNALQHAKAKTIDIRVDAAADVVSMVIRDDGIGFDAASEEFTRKGTGLGVLSERLAFAGGDCDIDTGPGRGTTIAVRLPVAHATIETSAGARGTGGPEQRAFHAW
jgi:signal transduction histidine kinase